MTSEGLKTAIRGAYIHLMKHTALITALTLCLSPPALAQDKDESGGQDNGLSLMEDGARMFLEGIQREMGPALQDFRGMAEDMGPAMRDFLQEMGPAFADVMDRIGDISAYHPPEILPNGDIILRRKTPGEPTPAPPAPGEEIEI